MGNNYTLLLFDTLDERSYDMFEFPKERLEDDAKYYEHNCNSIVSIYENYDYVTKVKCIRVFTQELLNSLHINSICDDQRMFTCNHFFMQEELYARLLIYRYEQNISILDDLHYEKSIDFLKETEKHLISWYRDLKQVESTEFEYQVERKYHELNKSNFKEKNVDQNELDLKRSKLDEMIDVFLCKYSDIC